MSTPLKMVCNAVYNAFLNALTTRVPLEISPDLMACTRRTFMKTSVVIGPTHSNSR